MNPECFARRAVCTAAAILCLSWTTASAADELPSFQQVQVQVDALKDQALRLGVQAAELRDRALDSAGPGTTVYLSSGNSGASIVAAGLAVDGVAPVFSGPLAPEEAQTLLQDNFTYRLARLALPPGTHHIHAEVSLKYPGDTEAHSLVVEQDCDIAAAPSEMVLAPEGGKTWLTSAALVLHRQNAGPVEGPGLIDFKRIWGAVNGPEVRDGAYRPGSNGDPRVGYARFLVATHDDFKAAVLLTRLSTGVPEAALPADFYQALTSALIGYDALAPAQQAYRMAVTAGADSVDAAELRIRIGEAYYQRQDYAGAEQAMQQAPSRRAKKQFTAWQDLRSRILLAQSRFEEASAALKAADAGADFDSYVRYYNLGIALIQNGLGPQGVTVLDRVGSVPGNDRDMLSLSDSANLALGSYLLQTGQGATAIPVLERVELSGRFSDRALFDLGWAWLAPAGTQQERVMLGDERTQGPPPETVAALHQPYDTQNLYQRYHLRPFVRAKLDDNRDAQLKRALAIWSELLGRDSASDAVQEAYLAAAMNLDDLGAHQEAAELYGRGIQALESASHATDEAGNYVHADQWVGDVLESNATSTRSDQVLRALPRSSVAVQLDGYMAGWRFQSGLQQYRQLEAVSANLKAAVAAAEGAAQGSDQAPVQILSSDAAELRRAVEAAKSAEVALLRQDLLAQLALRQRRLKKLIEAAHFEVARIYDGVRQ